MKSNSKLSKKEKQNRLVAQNTPLIMKLLRQYLPDVKSTDMLSQPMRRWVNSTASDNHFSEEWVIKQLKKKFPNANAYANRYQKLTSDDIQQMRENANREQRLKRSRLLELGQWLPDMTPEEEIVYISARELIALDEARSRNAYEADRSERRPAKSSDTPLQAATSTRLWLAAMKESEKTEFVSWCARRGLLPVPQNWNSFVDETQQRTVPVSDQSTSSNVFSAQDMLSESGWSDAEIADLTNDKLNDEYRAESERRERTTPHFDGKNVRYSRVEFRPAQGAFRAAVLDNWDNACAISGSLLVVEACHIIAHSKGGAATVENGIALAVDFHRLMDSGHLRIVNGMVRLSDEARNEPRYSGFHDTAIRVPHIQVQFPFSDDE